MALTFNMSAPTGNKSKQFNQAQSQLLGNLGGFANRASAEGSQALNDLNVGLGRYDRATQDLAAMGGENLQNFINTPGYTPTEQSSMRLAATAPLLSSFNTAAYQNQRGAALTGNAGTASAANAQLAREKARMLSGTLSGLQGNFANARREDTLAGVQAFPGTIGAISSAFQFPSTVRAQLYGQNLDAQLSALSGQQNAVEAYKQRSMQPGFLKQAALSGISGLTGGVGAGLGGLIRPQPPKQ